MRGTGRARQAGFTLVELLIVVTIIGILAAIAIPLFNDYRVKGFNSMAMADLRHAKIEFEAFHYEHSFYPR